MSIQGNRSSRPFRAAVLALCLGVLMAGCVSRNVERIDDEEAAGLGSAPAPTTGDAAEEPAAEPAGTAISGRLTVAPDVGDIPPGVLYLIVRVAGRETGAPLAVKRLEGASLPTDFRVSEADAMMPGTPLVGEMDVVARLDQDGDAFTEQPGDLQGRAGPVTAGDEVEIVLRASDGGESGS